MTHHYKVFSDGSASTHGCKAGGWAAVILKDDNMETIVYGGFANTTIGIVEMRAIIESLEYIQQLPCDGKPMVDVFCDRQDVVLSATGVYARRANRDEWKRFDRANKGLDVSVTHIPRNSIPEQALTDELSGRIREMIERSPTRVIHYTTTKL